MIEIVPSLTPPLRHDAQTQQTQEGVALFYNFAIKTMEAIDSVRDPERFAAKLQSYATLDDPTFQSLVARIESVRTYVRTYGADGARLAA